MHTCIYLVTSIEKKPAACSKEVDDKRRKPLSIFLGPKERGRVFDSVNGLCDW